MDTSLEWNMFVGQRRFTSGYRTVGGEEEDGNNQGRTKCPIWQRIDIFGFGSGWTAV